MYPLKAVYLIVLYNISTPAAIKICIFCRVASIYLIAGEDFGVEFFVRAFEFYAYIFEGVHHGGRAEYEDRSISTGSALSVTCSIMETAGVMSMPPIRNKIFL